MTYDLLRDHWIIGGVSLPSHVLFIPSGPWERLVSFVFSPLVDAVVDGRHLRQAGV